jgi:hypothetical protein
MASLVDMVGQPPAAPQQETAAPEVSIVEDDESKRIQDEKDRVHSFVVHLHNNAWWNYFYSKVLLAIEFILILASGTISSLSAAGYLETAQTSVKACISGVLQNSVPIETSSAMILECMKPSRASALACATLMIIAASVRMFSSNSRFDLKTDKLKRHATMADSLLTRFNRLGSKESSDTLSALIHESDALRESIGNSITIKEMKKVFQNASSYVDAQVSSLRAELDSLKEELIAATRAVPLNEIAVEVANAAPAATSAVRVGRILSRINGANRG